MTLSAVLTPADEGGFVAINPETGTATHGANIEEALANLRKATELYLEKFPLRKSGGTLLTTLKWLSVPKLPHPKMLMMDVAHLKKPGPDARANDYACHASCKGR